jgi:hypothetical protein
MASKSVPKVSFLNVVFVSDDLRRKLRLRCLLDLVVLHEFGRVEAGVENAFSLVVFA